VEYDVNKMSSGEQEVTEELKAGMQNSKSIKDQNNRLMTINEKLLGESENLRKEIYRLRNLFGEENYLAGKQRPKSIDKSAMDQGKEMWNVEQMEKDLRSKDKETNGLYLRIQEMEDEVTKLKVENLNLLQQIKLIANNNPDQLNRKLELVIRENSELQIQNQNLLVKTTQLETDLRRSKRSSKDASSLQFSMNSDGLKKRCEELQADNERLAQIIAELQNRLTQPGMKGTNSSSTVIEDRSKESKGTTIIIQQLEEKNKDLSDSLGLKVSEIESIKKKFDALNRQTQEEKKVSDSNYEKLLEFEFKVKTLERQRDKLVAERDDYAQRLEELERTKVGPSRISRVDDNQSGEAQGRIRDLEDEVQRWKSKYEDESKRIKTVEKNFNEKLAIEEETNRDLRNENSRIQTEMNKINITTKRSSLKDSQVLQLKIDELEVELEGKSQTLSRKEKDITALERRLKDEQSENISQLARIRDLEEEAQNLRDQLKAQLRKGSNTPTMSKVSSSENIDEILSSRDERINQLTRDLRIALEEIEVLKRELGNKGTMSKVWEEKTVKGEDVEKLERKIRDLEREVLEAQKNKFGKIDDESAKKEIEAMAADLKRIKADLSEKQEDVSRRDRTIRDLESQVTEAQKNKFAKIDDESAKKEIEAMAADLKRIKADLSEKQEDVSRRDRTIRDLESQVTEAQKNKFAKIDDQSAKKEIEAMAADLKRIKADLSEKQEDVSRRDRTIRDLESQVTEAQKNKFAKIDDQSAKKEIEAMAADLKRIKADLSEKQEDVSRRDRTIRDLESQVTEAQKNKFAKIDDESAKKEIEAMAADLKRIKADLSEKQEDVSRRDRTIRDLESQVTEAQKNKFAKIDDQSAKKEIEAMAADLKRIKADLSEKQEDVSRRDRTIRDLESQVTEAQKNKFAKIDDQSAKKEIEAMAADLKRIKADLSEKQEDVSRRDRTIRDLESQVTEAQKNKFAKIDDESAKKEIEAMAADLKRIKADLSEKQEDVSRRDRTIRDLESQVTEAQKNKFAKIDDQSAKKEIEAMAADLKRIKADLSEKQEDVSRRDRTIRDLESQVTEAQKNKFAKIDDESAKKEIEAMAADLKRIKADLSEKQEDVSRRDRTIRDLESQVTEAQKNKFAKIDDESAKKEIEAMAADLKRIKADLSEKQEDVSRRDRTIRDLESQVTEAQKNKFAKIDDESAKKEIEAMAADLKRIKADLSEKQEDVSRRDRTIRDLESQVTEAQKNKFAKIDDESAKKEIEAMAADLKRIKADLSEKQEDVSRRDRTIRDLESQVTEAQKNKFAKIDDESAKKEIEAMAADLKRIKADLSEKQEDVSRRDRTIRDLESQVTEAQKNKFAKIDDESAKKQIIEQITVIQRLESELLQARQTQNAPSLNPPGTDSSTLVRKLTEENAILLQRLKALSGEEGHRKPISDDEYTSIGQLTDKSWEFKKEEIRKIVENQLGYKIEETQIIRNPENRTISIEMIEKTPSNEPSSKKRITFPEDLFDKISSVVIETQQPLEPNILKKYSYIDGMKHMNTLQFDSGSQNKVDTSKSIQPATLDQESAKFFDKSDSKAHIIQKNIDEASKEDLKLIRSLFSPSFRTEESGSDNTKTIMKVEAYSSNQSKQSILVIDDQAFKDSQSKKTQEVVQDVLINLQKKDNSPGKPTDNVRFFYRESKGENGNIVLEKAKYPVDDISKVEVVERISINGSPSGPDIQLTVVLQTLTGPNPTVDTYTYTLKKGEVSSLTKTEGEPSVKEVERVTVDRKKREEEVNVLDRVIANPDLNETKADSIVILNRDKDDNINVNILSLEQTDQRQRIVVHPAEIRSDSNMTILKETQKDGVLISEVIDIENRKPIAKKTLGTKPVIMVSPPATDTVAKSDEQVFSNDLKDASSELKQEITYIIDNKKAMKEQTDTLLMEILYVVAPEYALFLEKQINLRVIEQGDDIIFQRFEVVDEPGNISQELLTQKLGLIIEEVTIKSKRLPSSTWKIERHFDNEKGSLCIQQFEMTKQYVYDILNKNQKPSEILKATVKPSGSNFRRIKLNNGQTLQYIDSFEISKETASHVSVSKELTQKYTLLVQSDEGRSVLIQKYDIPKVGLCYLEKRERVIVPKDKTHYIRTFLEEEGAIVHEHEVNMSNPADPILKMKITIGDLTKFSGLNKKAKLLEEMGLESRYNSVEKRDEVDGQKIIREIFNTKEGKVMEEIVAPVYRDLDLPVPSCLQKYSIEIVKRTYKNQLVQANEENKFEPKIDLLDRIGGVENLYALLNQKESKLKDHQYFAVLGYDSKTVRLERFEILGKTSGSIGENMRLVERVKIESTSSSKRLEDLKVVKETMFENNTKTVASIKLSTESGILLPNKGVKKIFDDLDIIHDYNKQEVSEVLKVFSEDEPLAKFIRALYDTHEYLSEYIMVKVEGNVATDKIAFLKLLATQTGLKKSFIGAELYVIDKKKKAVAELTREIREENNILVVEEMTIKGGQSGLQSLFKKVMSGNQLLNMSQVTLKKVTKDNPELTKGLKSREPLMEDAIDYLSGVKVSTELEDGLNLLMMNPDFINERKDRIVSYHKGDQQSVLRYTEINKQTGGKGRLGSMQGWEPRILCRVTIEKGGEKRGKDEEGEEGGRNYVSLRKEVMSYERMKVKVQSLRINEMNKVTVVEEKEVDMGESAKKDNEEGEVFLARVCAVMNAPEMLLRKNSLLREKQSGDKIIWERVDLIKEEGVLSDTNSNKKMAYTREQVILDPQVHHALLQNPKQNPKLSQQPPVKVQRQRIQHQLIYTDQIFIEPLSRDSEPIISFRNTLEYNPFPNMKDIKSDQIPTNQTLALNYILQKRTEEEGRSKQIYLLSNISSKLAFSRLGFKFNENNTSLNPLDSTFDQFDMSTEKRIMVVPSMINSSIFTPKTVIDNVQVIVETPVSEGNLKQEILSISSDNSIDKVSTQTVNKGDDWRTSISLASLTKLFKKASALLKTNYFLRRSLENSLINYEIVRYELDQNKQGVFYVNEKVAVQEGFDPLIIREERKTFMIQGNEIFEKMIRFRPEVKAPFNTPFNVDPNEDPFGFSRAPKKIDDEDNTDYSPVPRSDTYQTAFDSIVFQNTIPQQQVGMVVVQEKEQLKKGSPKDRVQPTNFGKVFSWIGLLNLTPEEQEETILSYLKEEERYELIKVVKDKDRPEMSVFEVVAALSKIRQVDERTFEMTTEKYDHRNKTSVEEVFRVGERGLQTKMDSKTGPIPSRPQAVQIGMKEMVVYVSKCLPYLHSQSSFLQQANGPQNQLVFETIQIRAIGVGLVRETISIDTDSEKREGTKYTYLVTRGTFNEERVLNELFSAEINKATGELKLQAVNNESEDLKPVKPYKNEKREVGKLTGHEKDGLHQGGKVRKAFDIDDVLDIFAQEIDRTKEYLIKQKIEGDKKVVEKILVPSGKQAPEILERFVIKLKDLENRDSKGMPQALCDYLIRPTVNEENKLIVQILKIIPQQANNPLEKLGSKEFRENEAKKYSIILSDFEDKGNASLIKPSESRTDYLLIKEVEADGSQDPKVISSIGKVIAYTVEGKPFYEGQLEGKPAKPQQAPPASFELPKSMVEDEQYDELNKLGEHGRTPVEEFVRHYESQLEKKKLRDTDLKVIISQSFDKLEVLSSDVKRLEIEIQSKSGDESLKRLLESKQKELDSANQEGSELRIQISKLKDRVQELELKLLESGTNIQIRSTTVSSSTDLDKSLDEQLDRSLRLLTEARLADPVKGSTLSLVYREKSAEVNRCVAKTVEELQTVRRAVEDLEKDNREMKRRVEELKALEMDLRREVAEAEGEMERLRKRLESEAEEGKRLREEVRELKDRKESPVKKNDEVELLRSENDSLRDQMRERKVEIDRLELLVIEMKNTRLSPEKVKPEPVKDKGLEERLKETFRSLIKEDVLKTEDEYASTSDVIFPLENRRLDRLLVAISKLLEGQDAIKKENKGLVRDIQDLQDKLRQLNITMEKEIQYWKDKSEEPSQRLKELEKSLEKSQSELQKQQKELDRLSDSLSTANKQLKSKEGELTQSGQENEELRAQIKELKDAINLLEMELVKSKKIVEVKRGEEVKEDEGLNKGIGKVIEYIKRQELISLGDEASMKAAVSIQACQDVVRAFNVLVQRNEDMVGTISSLNATIRDNSVRYEENMKKKDAEMDRQREKVEELQEEVRQARKGSDGLAERLERANKEIEALKVSMRDDSAMRQKEGEMAELRDENGRLRGELKESRDRLAEVEIRVLSVGQERDQLRSERDKLANKKVDLDAGLMEEINRLLRVLESKKLHEKVAFEAGECCVERDRLQTVLRGFGKMAELQERLAAENRALKEDVEFLGQKVAQNGEAAEKELQFWKEKVAKLNEEIAELKKQVQSLEMSLERYETSSRVKGGELEQQLKSKEGDIQQLTKENGLLTEELKGLREKLMIIETEVTRVTRERDQSASEKERLEKRRPELDIGTNNEMGRVLKMMEERKYTDKFSYESGETTVEKDKLLTMLKGVSRMADQLDKATQELRVSREDLKTQKERAEGLGVQLQKENDAAKERYGKLNEEMSSLRSKLMAAESKQGQVESERDGLKRELEAMARAKESELGSVRAEVARYREEAKEVRDRLSGLEMELSRVNMEKEGLRSEKEKLMNRKAEVDLGVQNEMNRVMRALEEKKFGEKVGHDTPDYTVGKDKLVAILKGSMKMNEAHDKVLGELKLMRQDFSDLSDRSMNLNEQLKRDSDSWTRRNNESLEQIKQLINEKGQKDIQISNLERDLQRIKDDKSKERSIKEKDSENEGLRSDLDQSRNEVKTLREKVQEFDLQILSLNMEKDKLKLEKDKQQTDDISQNLSLEINRAIQLMAGKRFLEPSIPSFDQRKANIESTRLTDLSRGCTAMLQACEKLEKDARSLKDSIETTKDKLAEAERKLTSAENKLSTEVPRLERNMFNLEKELRDSKRREDELSSKLQGSVDLKTFNDKLNRLMSELEDKKNANTQLEKENSTLNNTIISLQEKVNSLDMDLLDRNNKIVSLESTRNKLSDNEDDRRKQEAGVKKALDQMRDEVSQTRSENTKLKLTLESSIKHLKDAERTAQKYQEELEMRKRNTQVEDGLNAVIKELNANVTALRDKDARQDMEIKRMAREREGLEKEVELARDRVEHKEKQIRELNEMVLQKNSEVERLEGECSRKERENMERTREAESWKDRFTKLKLITDNNSSNQDAQTKQRISQLESDLDKAKKQESTFLSRISELETDTRGDRNKRAQLEGELEARLKEVKELSYEIESLKSTVKQLTQRLSEQGGKLNVLQADKDMDRRVYDLEEELNKARIENEGLVRRVKELEGDVKNTNYRERSLSKENVDLKSKLKQIDLVNKPSNVPEAIREKDEFIHSISPIKNRDEHVEPAPSLDYGAVFDLKMKNMSLQQELNLLKNRIRDFEMREMRDSSMINLMKTQELNINRFRDASPQKADKENILDDIGLKDRTTPTKGRGSEAKGPLGEDIQLFEEYMKLREEYNRVGMENNQLRNYINEMKSEMIDYAHNRVPLENASPNSSLCLRSGDQV
jgi:chromosome segregation ATPase